MLAYHNDEALKKSVDACSRRYTALADKLIEILGEAPVTRSQAA